MTRAEHALFVVGTDTNVGKTTICLGILRHLARRMRVAAMKPCETGHGDDAQKLIAATGRDLRMETVNPYRFALPAAPEIAARREGIEVDFAVIESAYKTLCVDADLTLVEGAGGLLVPLSTGLTTADLISHLDIPLLIVARTSLGTINHTLLTAELARQRGLRTIGLVFSQTHKEIGPEELETVPLLVRMTGLPCFGILPWISDEKRQDPAGLEKEFIKHISVETLLGAVIENQSA